MVRKVTRRTFTIRESGRSSDYISPSFGHGCLLDCQYCYMKRHKPTGLDVPNNIGDILTAINQHAYWDANVDKPNQTDSDYITYDISCNEDFALHSKYYDWERIFEFFKNHDKAKATLATKIIPVKFLSYNPEKKVRIRFSLAPQKMIDALEPNTPSAIERIKAIDAFIEAGYDVHINFSPVVVTDTWLEDYEELFEMVNTYVEYKDEVKCEVIFLTHNRKLHDLNVTKGRDESILWKPDMQVSKTSQYGGDNVRYTDKAARIELWQTLHQDIIPWCTIRYIF